MRCALCRGFGNLFCVQDGRREWWTCQACGGGGARDLLAALDRLDKFRASIADATPTGGDRG